MKTPQMFFLFILVAGSVFADESGMPVRVMTDGFNCKEGIIIADEVRSLVETDSLLRNYTNTDSLYLVIEITSFQDGSSAVIKASFSKVTPLQTFRLDYVFSRRLVSRTLADMLEISANILDKVHVIRTN
ncbi:MAG: hypothetical protein ACK2TU_11070 [Anaerolineales bacterium]